MPPIEYFVLLHSSGQAIVEQYETYQKQTYRNRCLIYTEKGKMALTIPVSKPFGNHTKTKDILIFNQDKWYIKHWRAIETAYLSAPFFIYYRDEIEPFFKTPFERLLDFNMQLSQLFCRIIGIETTITLSEDYMKVPGDRVDYRTVLSPKKPENIIKEFPEYIQVFETNHGFIPNLSILDLIFNLGPESYDYIAVLSEQIHL
ncbi:MAG: hypothetical protein DRI88_06110 [Bacteroidetes bacterium]|nr:MAG: hypothetical protein DRI88_06110 [Bacteroidota bacterium]